jgi:hypothetical protein
MPRTIRVKPFEGSDAEVNMIVLSDPPKRLEGNLRHGLFTKQLRFESVGDARTYARLRRELRREMFPANIVEETLVEKMSVALWKMRRATRADEEEGGLSPRAQAKLAALDREFHRAHHALQVARGVRIARAKVVKDIEFQQWKMEREDRRRRAEEEMAG